MPKRCMSSAWRALAGIGLLLFANSGGLYADETESKLFFDRTNGKIRQIEKESLREPIFDERFSFEFVYDDQTKIVTLDSESVSSKTVYLSSDYYYYFEPDDVSGFDLRIFDLQVLKQEAIFVSNLTLSNYIENSINDRTNNFRAADKILIEVQESSVRDIVKILLDKEYDLAQDQLNEYLKKYPEDLFGNILQLDLISRQDDQEKLRNALAIFKDKFQPDGKDIVDYTIKLHERNIAALESYYADLNIEKRKRELVDKLNIADVGYATTSYKDNYYIFLDYDQTPDFWQPGSTVMLYYTDLDVPNFLSLQVFSKLCSIKSDFWMMQGEKENAEDLLIQNLRLGIGMTEKSSTLIGHLIGLALVDVTRERMEHLYLNAFQSPEELAKAFEKFDSLYEEFESEENMKYIFNHPSSSSQSYLYEGNLIESEFRYKSSLTRLANLRTAISLRHYFLEKGSWPEADSTGELLDEPTVDPYSSENKPLKVLRANKDLIVYSIGPDQLDAEAKAEYNINNGTESVGDITLKVHRERLYPFPEEKPSYDDRLELTTSYPNGLPDDPFADTRGRSYAITHTNPPIVWSQGPDADQSHYKIEEDPRPEPIQGYSAARYPDGTWMKLRNDISEPAYDATNGTISNGNLYLNF